jgi:hypothetical protein
MSQNNNQDNTIKTIGIAALSVIIFAVLYNLLLGGRGGFGFGMGYNSGFGLNSLIGSILGLAVQLLWLVFIVSLVVGGVLLVKKHLLDEKKINLDFLNLTGKGSTCPCCGTKLTTEFNFCPNCKASLKETCAKCSKDLQMGWKCCPVCGTETTSSKD